VGLELQAIACVGFAARQPWGATMMGEDTRRAAELLAVLRSLVRAEIAAALPGPTEPCPAWLSTSEAATHARVTAGTVRRWIREGRLRPHRAGRELRVSRAELDALIAAPCRTPTSEQTPEDRARSDFEVNRRQHHG
jgi:excisionase family DNA binding protein